MSASRVPDYLDHMLEAALQACAYAEGLSKEEFLHDKRTQQAVILNLILIGEEATKLLKDDEAFADQLSAGGRAGAAGLSSARQPQRMGGKTAQKPRRFFHAHVKDAIK